MSTTVELLRELRSRGLTQVAISERTLIPQPRLSRWESGAVPIGADDALRLKSLLDEVRAAEPVAQVEAAGEGMAAVSTPVRPPSISTISES